jgi:hypothetical protein
VSVKPSLEAEMKSVAAVGAFGIVGLIVTKLLWMLMLPILGMFIGFMVLVLKIALIGGLIWLGYSLFKKMVDKPSEA